MFGFSLMQWRDVMEFGAVTANLVIPPLKIIQLFYPFSYYDFVRC